VESVSSLLGIRNVLVAECGPFEPPVQSRLTNDLVEHSHYIPSSDLMDLHLNGYAVADEAVAQKAPYRYQALLDGIRSLPGSLNLTADIPGSSELAYTNEHRRFIARNWHVTIENAPNWLTEWARARDAMYEGAFFDGQKAFEALAHRMDAQAELRVTLLLNIQRKRGDTTAADQLVRRFADRFWGSDWPGTSRPNVYYDPRALEMNGPGGVLHAKAVVVDDLTVFITSANLTEAALDRNIEVGLLVRDRALALSVSTHFKNLIDRELLRPLPMT
jgi:hypothetical protein